jgi:hypothetical protein
VSASSPSYVLSAHPGSADDEGLTFRPLPSGDVQVISWCRSEGTAEGGPRTTSSFSVTLSAEEARDYYRNARRNGYRAAA